MTCICCIFPASVKRYHNGGTGFAALFPMTVRAATAAPRALSLCPGWEEWAGDQRSTTAPPLPSGWWSGSKDTPLTRA